MSLTIPRADGTVGSYEPTHREPLPANASEPTTRVAYAAAHVVADPLSAGDPTGPAQLDWETTLHFRRHLWAHGLRECKVQRAQETPKSVWNPDLPDPVEHRASWTDVPASEPPENGFKLQWEAFLRHVVLDEPFPWDFVEGARGVQLYELGEQSWRERRWVDVPELTL